jgi:hypothetical protein
LEKNRRKRGRRRGDEDVEMGKGERENGRGKRRGKRRGEGGQGKWDR